MNCLLDEIIFETKLALRLQDTTDHDAWIDILCDEAVRMIDSVDTFQDCSYVFDVTSNKVKLPSGFKKWGALRFIETVSSDSEVAPFMYPRAFNQILYVDFQFLQNCNISQTELQNAGATPYTTVCKINRGYIVFNSDITSLYTKGELSYKGLATDEQGRKLIHEDYKRAIRYYICSEFARSYPERYDRSVRTEWAVGWSKQKDWLRGIAARESFDRNRWVVQNLMRHIKVNTI